jgi:hypothetical protein
MNLADLVQSGALTEADAIARARTLISDATAR